MIKSTTIFLLLFCCTLSFAQIESYPLADYFRPDVQRRTASYGGDFSFVNRNENRLFSGKKSRIALDLSADAFFTNFKNTMRNQISSNTTYQIGFSHITNNVNEKDYNNGLGIRVSRNYSNKIFKNEDKRFFELSYRVDINPNIVVNRNQNNNFRTYEKLFTTNIQVPLYWGKGRIELVNGAWQAATILEFLRDESLLQTTTISHEEITNFANRVAEIRQFRNTDFRLEDIAEYEALVAYLIENNLIDPSQYKTFAILQDAWRFESFITRRSGNEFKYGFISGFSLFATSNSIDDLFDIGTGVINESPSLLASVAYNSYKPINMDWQIDFTNELNLGVSAPDNFPNEFGRSTVLNAQVRLGQSISYIPNQRTFYRLTASTSYVYQKSISTSSLNNYRQNLLLRLSGQYNYYVSPKLAWSLRANFSYFGSSSFLNSTYDNENGIFASISYRPY